MAVRPRHFAKKFDGNLKCNLSWPNTTAPTQARFDLWKLMKQKDCAEEIG